MLEGNYYEPFLQERLDDAKKRAEDILSGTIATESDLEMVLRVVISKYYRIPIFDRYFSDRTIDELMFEAHIITKPEASREEAATNFVSENLDAMVNAVEDAWEEVSAVKPSQEELERMGAFMNTGKFEGEEPSEF